MGRDGFLGEFEQMLLLAALRLGDDAFGTRLMEELDESVGRRVSRGAVYVTLNRLEEKGLLTSQSSPAEGNRGGRPRRVVTVTPEGRTELRRTRDALRTLWSGVEDALDSA